MKKKLIPKSAFVGFFLRVIIAAVTIGSSFIFKGMFDPVYLVPILLLSPIVDTDLLISSTLLNIWVAIFCIIGGLIVPVVCSIICVNASESTRIKTQKICNILVTLSFAPYIIFALISAIVLLSIFPIMSMLDVFDISKFIVLLFTLATVILLLPKPKFDISSEVGCTFLIMSLALHVLFMLSVVVGFDHYGADILCMLFYIVCVANLVIIRIFEQLHIHKLQRTLLTSMSGVSCLYSTAFIVNSIFSTSTDFSLITLPYSVSSLCFFVYMIIAINRAKEVAE